MVDNETRAKVMSYIRGQAVKLSLAEIGVRVQAAYDALAEASAGLSAKQKAFKPAPREWSAAEVVPHLIASNRLGGQVVLALARGEAAEAGNITAYAVPGDDDLLALIAAGREEVGRLVAALPAEPVLEITAEHPAFGPLNCKEWLLFLRVHTLDHAQQVQALRAAPGFPGG